MTDVIEIVFKGTDNFSSTASGIGGAFKKLGGVVAAGAAAGIAGMAALGASSVKAAMDMETQMSNIASVLNTTVSEIQPLDDLIQELGLNPNLKVDAVEAAAAIEMLARNGLDMTEIMEGAAESTVLLANATGAEFGNAANIATDAMAIFNIEASDMMDAVDGIVSVTTNSKFTIDDFSLALAQGGGVASAAGVSFDDFNTTIAAISPLFASGSDAGTSLKTMMLRLIPTTTKAEEAMYDLGLIGDDMSNAFFDAGGNMKSMSQVAGLLENAFAGLSEEQKTSYMQTIFGTDAMRAAIALADTGEAAFVGLGDAMAETDAAANAATRMDNLAGVMEVLKGIFDAVVLSLGKGVVPLLRMFADQALKMADTILPVINSGMETLSTIVQSFTNNLSEGMSPLNAFIEAIWDFVPQEILNRLVNLRDNIIPALQEKIQEFLAPIQAAVGSFFEWKDVLIGLAVVLAGVVLSAIVSVATAMAPILLALAAIVAAVAVVRQVWENDWLGIRTTLEEFWLNVGQPIFEQLKIWLGENIPIALQFLTDVWNNYLLPALQAVWQFLAVDMMPIWEALGTLIKTVIITQLKSMKAAWQVILLPALTKVYNFLNDNLGPAFLWLKNKVIGPVSDSLGGLTGIISSVAEGISNLAASLSNISLPDWMQRNSPSPIEQTFMGWRDELKALNRFDLPALNTSLQGLQSTTNRSTTVNQNTTIYTSSVDTRAENQAGLRFALGGI